MVDTVRAHRPDLSEEQVVHFLLHTARGRSVAEHISSITKSKEEPTMSRLEQLRDISKRYGLEAVAKSIVDDGDAGGVTEGEFTKLMQDEAARRGMTFSKFFEAPGVDVLRAWQLSKNTRVAKDSLLQQASLTPTQTFVGDTSLSLEEDSAEAIRLLTEMAERQYAAGKYRSVHSAFAAVFSDQANATLAARAHRRPSAANGSNYPFPR
jgi:hypothetical protein